MKKDFLSVLCFVLLLPIGSSAEQTVKVASPSGRLEIAISDVGDRLTFKVLNNGREVVEESQLGIRYWTDWGENTTIEEVKRSSENSVWKPAYGERAEIPDRYNAAEITLGYTKTPDRMILDVRAYDQGVAFRYRFIGSGNLNITEDHTEYVMPEGTMAYFTMRAQTPYELLPLKDWPSESDRPLVLALADGGYVCLAEAEVVDYARTKFALSTDKKNTIKCSMFGPVEALAPFSTPWHVVMYADRAGELVENNFLLLNLNPPCEIADTDWIKPGKAMREVTLTTEGGMALVDFAVKRNLQYIHFDAGWYGPENDRLSDATTITLDPHRNPNPDALDLHKVIDYAKSKGVKVILYVNHRALQQQLSEIIPLYASWGVAGIKFGFVEVGDRMWTKWMHEAVKLCAEHHLVVDIHDEYRPTGFSRTYPNLLTQEGIRGNEEFPDATHNCTLPFTRFVAGAGDYTICYYRQDFGALERQQDTNGVPRSKSIQTTPSHQLALAVVYYSPLQYLYWYDKPSDSRDEPELKFFDDVYTVWDDTRFLDGEIGEFATVMRRKGSEWFVGAITNNDARRKSIKLDFLPAGGDYVAEIYTDGDRSIPTRTKVKVSKFKVDSGSVLNLSLKASGGAAIRIVPATDADSHVKKYKKQSL